MAAACALALRVSAARAVKADGAGVLAVLAVLMVRWLLEVLTCELN